MTGDQFGKILVPLTMSWIDAAARMNEAAQGILLAVDADGRLVRTVTDGDLRRAMLDHSPDLLALGELPRCQPIVVGEAESLSDIQKLLATHGISHVPIVDDEGRPVDLVSSRELSQRIWLSPPHLGEEETAFVAEAFRSNWIAPLGPNVDAFEQEVAAYAGVGHAAALSSGTAAIHLGLQLLGVQQGDTVFCSSLTFVASCNPILYCGAQPVFIDSEPDTWNMSPRALERAFEWALREKRLPRCVIIVNLYGQSADMDPLLAICRRYGVPVLEDAAESLGARYKNRCSGSFGELAVFSFNGNKIITTSGGGMLVSNDESLIRRARKLATQAREPMHHYEHAEVGFNYRMSNVLAGIGRGQLHVLNQRVASRRDVFHRYRDALSDMEELHWMPEPEGFESTRWLSCLTVGNPIVSIAPEQQKDLARRCMNALHALERHAIEARPVWKPMHQQPLFAGAPFFSHGPSQDVAARLFATGICLPSGSGLSMDQQDRVIDILRSSLSEKKRRVHAPA